MPENKRNVGANTQMFQAFVDAPPTETSGTRWIWIALAVAALVIVLAVAGLSLAQLL